jgi:hypothetical protein
MRLPRYRLRTPMLAVAAVAIVLGADGVRRRRDRFLALRSGHEAKEHSRPYLAEAHTATAAQNEGEARKHRAAARSRPREPHAEFAETFEAVAGAGRAAERRHRALARYHGELRLEYARAARHPWLTVAPGPPEPE